MLQDCPIPKTRQATRSAEAKATEAGPTGVSSEKGGAKAHKKDNLVSDRLWSQSDTPRCVSRILGMQ